MTQTLPTTAVSPTSTLATYVTGGGGAGANSVKSFGDICQRQLANALDLDNSAAPSSSQSNSESTFGGVFPAKAPITKSTNEDGKDDLTPALLSLAAALVSTLPTLISEPGSPPEIGASPTINASNLTAPGTSEHASPTSSANLNLTPQVTTALTEPLSDSLLPQIGNVSDSPSSTTDPRPVSMDAAQTQPSGPTYSESSSRPIQRTTGVPASLNVLLTDTSGALNSLPPPDVSTNASTDLQTMETAQLPVFRQANSPSPITGSSKITAPSVFEPKDDPVELAPPGVSISTAPTEQTHSSIPAGQTFATADANQKVTSNAGSASVQVAQPVHNSPTTLDTRTMSPAKPSAPAEAIHSAQPNNQPRSSSESLSLPRPPAAADLYCPDLPANAYLPTSGVTNPNNDGAASVRLKPSEPSPQQTAAPALTADLALVQPGNASSSTNPVQSTKDDPDNSDDSEHKNLASSPSPASNPTSSPWNSAVNAAANAPAGASAATAQSSKTTQADNTNNLEASYHLPESKPSNLATTAFSPVHILSKAAESEMRIGLSTSAF